MASSDEWRGCKWNSLSSARKSGKPADSRFRHVTLFLIAAVITAAVLRHTVHVYGGIPPEEIRTAAVIGILSFTPISALVALYVERRRRR